jgi:hypothetical protein
MQIKTPVIVFALALSLQAAFAQARKCTSQTAMLNPAVGAHRNGFGKGEIDNATLAATKTPRQGPQCRGPCWHNGSLSDLVDDGGPGSDAACPGHEAVLPLTI